MFHKIMNFAQSLMNSRDRNAKAIDVLRHCASGH